MASLFNLIAASILLLAGCARWSARSTPDSASESGKSHFARYGTNKIYYLAAGRGKQTLVFVHGWACNGGFWREQIPALANRARLLVIDLPGHGQSDKPAVDYTMDYFAGAVLAVMRDARIERATLVGHSMGTPVICRVFAKAPEKVAGLVAVHGPLRRPKTQPAQVEEFIAAYRTAAYREEVRKFVSSMFPSAGTEELRDQVISEMLATPQQVMSSAMDNMFDASKPAWDLERVNVPVLAINTESPMWTTNYQAYVRSLSPKTDYRTIQGAGHFFMLEKPAEFNAALVEALKEFDLVGRE